MTSVERLNASGLFALGGGVATAFMLPPDLSLWGIPTAIIVAHAVAGAAVAAWFVWPWTQASVDETMISGGLYGGLWTVVLAHFIAGFTVSVHTVLLGESLEVLVTGWAIVGVGSLWLLGIATVPVAVAIGGVLALWERLSRLRGS